MKRDCLLGRRHWSRIRAGEARLAGAGEVVGRLAGHGRGSSSEPLAEAGEGWGALAKGGYSERGEAVTRLSVNVLEGCRCGVGDAHYSRFSLLQERPGVSRQPAPGVSGGSQR